MDAGNSTVDRWGDRGSSERESIWPLRLGLLRCSCTSEEGRYGTSEMGD